MDCRPGVRILFTSAPVPPYPVFPFPNPPYSPAQPPLTDSQGNPSFGTQLELIQQPEDYNAGQWTSINSTPTPIGAVTYPPGTVLGFSAVDFQGGAAYAGEIDESTVQAGDYFVVQGTTVPHQITQVVSPTQIVLASSAGTTSNIPYAIVRAPRRLPSEDIIQMPSNMIIDNSAVPGNAGFNYCSNIPQRGLIDSSHPSPGVPVSEILFAPSGAVVGQGTQADKIYLWLRDSKRKALAENRTADAPRRAAYSGRADSDGTHRRLSRSAMAGWLVVNHQRSLCLCQKSTILGAVNRSFSYRRDGYETTTRIHAD